VRLLLLWKMLVNEDVVPFLCLVTFDFLRYLLSSLQAILRGIDQLAWESSGISVAFLQL
jgi:hypothetical protein